MATITTRKQQDGRTRTTAQIRLKVGGQSYSESRTFGTRAAAVAWARQREDEIKAHPDQVARKSATIGALIEAYLQARVDPLGRSKGQHLRMLITYPIASLDATRLTVPPLIEHISARRQAGTGASTVANDLIWLRVVWRYARLQGYAVRLEVLDEAAEYCRAERLTARPGKRSRRPTRAELARIVERFSRLPPRAPPMRLILWFAIYSCRRQAEIFALRLGDYDRERGTWLVRAVKHPGGSAGHDLPMRVTDRLKPLIEAIIREVPREDDRLLPFNPKSVGAYWQKQMKLLGIEDLHFHDLRREGASRLAEDGLTIPEIQQVTLHESWSSLQITSTCHRAVWGGWSGILVRYFSPVFRSPVNFTVIQNANFVEFTTSLKGVFWQCCLVFQAFGIKPLVLRDAIDKNPVANREIDGHFKPFDSIARLPTRD